MWDEVLQFVQNRGADRVLMLTFLGISLVLVSVYYKFRPEKYVLHIIFTLLGMVVLYPVYNYSIDYIEMSSSIVHLDPAQRPEVLEEIYKVMEWHIWYPAIFIIISLLLVVSVRFSKEK